MSGFVGSGRLQDAEWLMRACVIMNRDLPSGVPDYTEDTELNRSYTQQQAEFEALLDRIDPEGDIDRSIFPAVAYFNAAEEWPLDIIFAGLAMLAVWLFVPNWYGIAQYVAYILVGGFVAIQYLRSRQKRVQGEAAMRVHGLNPNKRYVLTLRMLVKHRRTSATVH